MRDINYVPVLGVSALFLPTLGVTELLYFICILDVGIFFFSFPETYIYTTFANIEVYESLFLLALRNLRFYFFRFTQIIMGGFFSEVFI